MTEELDMNALIKHEDMLPDISPEPPDGTLTKTKGYIREVIGESDPKLLEVWDELEKVSNTNEVIKFNLQQAQVHLQQEQVRYYILDAKVQQEMQKITDTVGLIDSVGPDAAEIQIKAHESCRKSLEQSRKYILSLGLSVTAMAKEYRQCMMQQEFIVHIVKVQQLLMGIRASIDANVHDLNALKAIRADMKELNRDLFGVR